jgi:large subunit ribosomal protein L38e
MPKEIKDLKEFIKIMRREQKNLPSADRIVIKKNRKSNSTKFKLRTPKYLLTLKVDDKNKAEKIMQSIPPNLKKETKN